MWIGAPLIHNRCFEAFLCWRRRPTATSPSAGRNFDLLKTVGTQAASYLAEERASRELGEAQKFADIREAGEIRVAVSAPPTEAVVEEIDNGPGMTPQFICDHLFRPLGASKPTSSGDRRLPQRLAVDSNTGQGTTMQVIRCCASSCNGRCPTSRCCSPKD